MDKKPPEPPTQPAPRRGMRALRIRSVYVTCSACDWQDDLFIPSSGPHVRCAKCGRLGASVKPDWTQLHGEPGAPRR